MAQASVAQADSPRSSLLDRERHHQPPGACTQNTASLSGAIPGIDQRQADLGEVGRVSGGQ